MSPEYVAVRVSVPTESELAGMVMVAAPLARLVALEVKPPPDKVTVPELGQDRIERPTKAIQHPDGIAENRCNGSGHENISQTTSVRRRERPEAFFQPLDFSVFMSRFPAGGPEQEDYASGRRTDQGHDDRRKGHRERF